MIVLRVPKTRAYLFRMARNFSLVSFGLWLTVQAYRIPATQFHRYWAVALLTLLCAVGAELAELVMLGRWRGALTKLQPALSPILAQLQLGPPKAIYSDLGIRLAWVEKERSFELLLRPRRREAALHQVDAPNGFSLDQLSLDEWCTFNRPDLVLEAERRRGAEFADRVPWKQLGSIALRASSPELAVSRVLQLIAPADSTARSSSAREAPFPT